MHVTFVAHSSLLYGANRSLLSLIDGLEKRGVTPLVIVPKGPLAEVLRSKHIETIECPVGWWVSPRPVSTLAAGWTISKIRDYAIWKRQSIRRLLGVIRWSPMLIQEVRKRHSDIIYTNSSLTPVGAVLSTFTQRPHIWHMREFNHREYSGFDFDWGTRLSSYIMRTAQARVAISEAVKHYYFGENPPTNTYTIFNGVASVDRFEYLKQTVTQLPISKSAFTFGVIGSIQSGKGQDVAIQALALLKRCIPNVRLIIVGAGDIEWLVSISNEFDIGNDVEHWGFIDDPWRAFMACDAILVPNKSEAMGRVTAEAMAACRPVIGYNSGGTAEIIEHERTGLLYQGDAKELAHCMWRFAAKPEWARELGIAGWHSARQKFTIEDYVRKVNDVLSTVLHQHT